MIDMPAVVKRAADKCGFSREYFVEDEIPTLPSNIIVFPFFGTLSSCSILSQFLLRRYKEMRTNKYLVLASWPGMKHLFPFVDEYWSPKDSASVQALASMANDFYNESDLVTEYNRSLNNYFENVISYAEIKPYYDYGFTQEFWESFRNVKSYLPTVPSHTVLSNDFQIEMSKKQGRKVVVYPAKKMRSWQTGKCCQLSVSKDFWLTLVNRLISEGFIPVVYQNWFTYDLSPEFTDRCIWLATKDAGHVLSGLRSVGCLLDIHTGISRLANIARCSSLVVDERQRYVSHKEYELDDLSPLKTPRQYVFSFCTRLMTGGPSEWNLSLLDGIISRLEKWTPDLNESIETREIYEEVSYDSVRKYKNMRLGSRFIRKY